MANEYVVGLFTLAGGLIGGGFTWLAARRRDRLEERKHLRELALKLAVLKFERTEALAQALADRTGKFQEHPPIEAFVLHALRFMDLLDQPGLTPEELGRRLAELQTFSRGVRDAAKQHQQR